MTTMTLLHPGAMGAAVGEQAVHGGARVLWVPDGRSHATRLRAEKAGMEACGSLADALAVSDLAVSLCPPHAAEEVARQVAGLPYAGVFVDANAISPHRMERIAVLFSERGAAVVDGAVFGPPPTGGRRASLCLSGDRRGVRALADAFEGTDLQVRALERPIGSASALKMAFAGFQKAARTIAAVSHALAEAHGVAAELVEQAQTMPADILTDADYLPSVAARAWRWAPEMHEVAETLRQAGLPDDIAQATASVMLRWEGDKDRFDMPLPEVFAHLRTGDGQGSADEPSGDARAH
ncbi:NAD(P)-dependent oxidoreductase [Streptomyces mangrovi]|uniref:NAD(P)-dependent oxidoreductase n=1 Tax=Streptomyces mangrovi TaxID=1206892 RepID=UPI00399D0AEE